MRSYLNKINKVGDNEQTLDTFSAGEFNSIGKELNNVLISAGITFSELDSGGEDVLKTQLAQAIYVLAQKSIWWVDNSIVANQIILLKNDSMILVNDVFKGQKVSWVNAIANTGATTIKVGNYPELPLKTLSGNDLGIEDLRAGGYYSAIYDGAFWRVENIFSQSFTGQIYAGIQQPNSLLCDGSEINRITYARLFSRVGTIFGAGDGLNTFNLPNLINRMPRGTGSLINEGEIQEDGTSTKGLSANTTIATKTGLQSTSIVATKPLASGISWFGIGDYNASNNILPNRDDANFSAFNFPQVVSNNDFHRVQFRANDGQSLNIKANIADHTHGATTTLTSTLTETRVKALGLKWWIYY